MSSPSLHPIGPALDRRDFLKVVGTGILVSVTPVPGWSQNRREPGGRSASVIARVHIGVDGTITVMTGKIEMGQGARAQLSQAAAEELRVSVDRIQLIMGDTRLVPDDGITAGSRTTPSTVPSVRQGAAAARDVLRGLAAKLWQVPIEEVSAQGGTVAHEKSRREIAYADLVKDKASEAAFESPVPAGITLTPVGEWKTMGTSVPRPNGRDLVSGRHQFPSDLRRPRMLYGKVLRPPAFGAKLVEIDLGPAEAMDGVVVAKEGGFVGVAAPSAYQARQALAAIASTARWESAKHPSSRAVYDYLKERARSPEDLRNPFASQMAAAKKQLRQAYRAAYLQHAPLEPRTALAEWNNGELTVWTGTQNPFGYHSELASAFKLGRDKIRVIVPDFGGGFGGKHTAEAAIEAARLAEAAHRPVLVRWTREEEFTWAYFRPAAVIEVEAGLDENQAIHVWHYVNINSGQAGIDTPYRIPHARSRYIASDSPLRQGSYRTLAATANHFARESFMDELAVQAGIDPLAFRLAHLDHPRLRAVLETAAARFQWSQRVKQRQDGTGIGLACGTEKGSYVAACVEILADKGRREIQVKRVCEVFECGAVINPDNLLAQVQGCILMGLGGALWEGMEFEDGRMLNASFRRYRVPRFKDLPELDLHLLNRPDLPSVGGGETPIVALAPAIANALHQATGVRIRQMPIQLAWKTMEV
jgi:isoquinoline 1-oxidoreductase